MNSKQTLYTIFTAGALTLSLAGAHAQVVSTPFGNLPFGARPVSLSPSASYTANRFNTTTQNYGVFGGANGTAAFPVGALNGGYGYTFYGLGGSTSPFGSASYFGYGLPTVFGGYPYNYAVSGNGSLYAGNNISVLDSPPIGGFTALNANGATFVGPNGQLSDPTLMSGGNVASVYGRAGGINGIYGQSGRNANAQTGNGQSATTDSLSDTNAATASLKQLIVAQQDANFNLRIQWLGNPALIDAMNVTLLNQYHLPITSNTASAGLPVTFAASRSVYNARYYRVDIQFADGAVTTMTGRIKR